MALDLGISIPNFIPAVPQFEVKLDDLDYNIVRQQFEKSCKEVFENPAIAISLSYTTLESLVKHIIKKEEIIVKKGITLPKLVGEIFKNLSEDEYIKPIISTLTNLCTQIEDLRSNKGSSHGTGSEHEIIKDPALAAFVVNSTASIGLLLINLMLKDKKDVSLEEVDVDEIPF